MMKTIAALMFGAVVATGLTATHAFAAPVGPAPVPTTSQSDLYQQADVNFSIGVGGGNRYRHRRCDYNGFGCNNYYGDNRYYGRHNYYGGGGYYGGDGYYGGGYDQYPFFGFPSIVIGNSYRHRGYGHRYRSHGSRHVNWCSNRYRSYNVRSDTWISNSGQRRQCVSPY